jgi:antitoxin component of RelBE/YafQ-DinJ toxin-antitoxin module
MPNRRNPHNKRRSVVVPDDLWHAAQAKAEERGETVSDAIRRFLERYVRRG